MVVSLERWARQLGVVDDEDAVSALRQAVGRLEDARAEVQYVRGSLLGDPFAETGAAVLALDRAVESLAELAYGFQCHEHERGSR
jgi:hypothetical protein